MAMTEQETSFCGFLNLPDEVRANIYRFIPLTTKGIVDSENDETQCFVPNQLLPWEWREFNDWEERHNTLSLLLTCRSISHDVSELVYSTNQFWIRLSDDASSSPYNGAPIRSLRPSSISYLTYVTVSLNVPQQPQPTRWHRQSMFRPWSRRPKFINRRNLPPLDFDAYLRCHHEEDLMQGWELAEGTIRNWHELCQKMGPHIEPGQLTLQLLSDVRDEDQALSIIQALDCLPRLARCYISLANSRDERLAKMARDASIRMTSANKKQRENRPFEFLKLPRELRLEILGYTDLITPMREVYWSPDRKYHLIFELAQCSGVEEDEDNGDAASYDDFKYCPVTMHHSCRYRYCQDERSLCCFCPCNHAAYWPRCKCWSPPSALFLTSKELRQDAMEIFFKRNRFIVMPKGGRHDFVESTPERTPLSYFLRDVVPHTVSRYIRFLEVVFPPFEHKKYLLADSSYYQDWLATIELAKEALDLPRLTLRVIMANIGGPTLSWAYYRTGTGPKAAVRILEVYQRVYAPLAGLRACGLEHFHAYVEWPRKYFGWSNFEVGAGKYTIKEWEKVLERRTADLNDQIEKLVMGQSYNAIKNRKERIQKAQWALMDNHFLAPEADVISNHGDESDEENGNEQVEDEDAALSGRSGGSREDAAHHIVAGFKFDDKTYASDYDTDGDEESTDEEETDGEDA